MEVNQKDRNVSSQDVLQARPALVEYRGLWARATLSPRIFTSKRYKQTKNPTILRSKSLLSQRTSAEKHLERIDKKNK